MRAAKCFILLQTILCGCKGVSECQVAGTILCGCRGLEYEGLFWDGIAWLQGSQSGLLRRYCVVARVSVWFAETILRGCKGLDDYEVCFEMALCGCTGLNK